MFVQQHFRVRINAFQQVYVTRLFSDNSKYPLQILAVVHGKLLDTQYRRDDII